jgi:hypothetical protein
MIVLVGSSLASSAYEVKYCKTNKDCGSGSHCQLGFNPEAGGISVENTWCWPTQKIDCPPGINPNEPSPCVK